MNKTWIDTILKWLDAILSMLMQDGGKEDTPPSSPAPGAPTPPTTPSPAPTPLPPPWDLGQLAIYKQLLESHNRMRASSGAAPLREVSSITDIAQRHASYLAARDRFDNLHGRPHGRSLDSDFRDTGWHYRTYGENAAAGYKQVVDVMAGWKSSPGHYRNIIDNRFRFVGFGYSVSSTGRPFWVTMFCD